MSEQSKKRRPAFMTSVLGLGLVLSWLLFFATGAFTYYYDSIVNNALIKAHLDIKGPTTSTSTLSVEGLSQLYGVRAKPYVVNNINQLTAVSGASVFVINPALGNHFRIDAPAIYASCDPTTTTGATVFKRSLSGITVVAGSAAPTAANDGYRFTVEQWGDSSATPWTLWVPQTSGVTPLCNLLAVYPVSRSGTSVFAYASSVSGFPVDRQYEQRTYQLNYNSGVSITYVHITESL